MTHLHLNPNDIILDMPEVWSSETKQSKTKPKKLKKLK
jgi:hypothetical protein